MQQHLYPTDQLAWEGRQRACGGTYEMARNDENQSFRAGVVATCRR